MKRKVPFIPSFPLSLPSSFTPLFIALDTESTGISCYSDHVVELAAVAFSPFLFNNRNNNKTKYSKGKEKSKLSFLPTFCSRIKTERPIHYRATQVHGIKNKDLINEKDFTQVYMKWSKWILENKQFPNQPVVMIAHNGRKFDFPILWREMNRSQFNIETEWKERLNVTHIIDSLEYFRKSFSTTPEDFKLTTLYQTKFGKPLEHAHSALYDTVALTELLTCEKEPSSWSTHLLNETYGITDFSTVWNRFLELTKERPLEDVETRLSIDHYCKETYYSLSESNLQCRTCWNIYSSYFPTHTCVKNIKGN